MEESWALGVRRLGTVLGDASGGCVPPERVSAVVESCEEALSSRRVACILTADRAACNELHMLMHEAYSRNSPPSVVGEVFEGSVYAACVESFWRRVCVEEVDVVERSCSVRLLDVGCTRRLNLSQLHRIGCAFINGPYAKRFAVQFLAPSADPQSTHFASVRSLSVGNAVEIFVLSDEEPFLALFAREGARILPEHLTAGLDAEDAQQWKASFSGGRLRGIPYGFYPAATLPTSNFFNDVTVASFESLSSFHVRDPEQSVRLIFLDKLMASIYGDEEARAKFVFEARRFVVEMVACAVWSKDLKKWLRGRVQCVNSEQSAVDVLCVDRPSMRLLDVQLHSGQLLTLPSSLLFRPLCSRLRAESSSDGLETTVRSLAARDAMRLGTRIRICSSPTSTFASVEVGDGLSLDAYISHQLLNNSGFGGFGSIGLGSAHESSVFSRSLTSMSHDHLRLTSTPVRGFGKSYVSSLQPLDERSPLPSSSKRPFAQSFSLQGGSSSSRQAARGLVSSLKSSEMPFAQSFTGSSGSRRRLTDSQKSSADEVSLTGGHRRFLGSSFAAYKPPSPKSMLATSKTSGEFRVPSVPASKTNGEFRVPSLPEPRPLCFGISAFNNFERDYLNRTVTSCDSETDSDVFTKSMRTSRLRRLNCSSYDSHSDSDGTRGNSMISAHVLNAKCAVEIYIETKETRRRSLELKRALSSIQEKLAARPRLHTFALFPGHVFLYATGEERLLRVRIADRAKEESESHGTKDENEIHLVDVDTGKELDVSKNSSNFYNVPSAVGLESFPPACVGPLRLAGAFDESWLLMNATMRLRQLCESAVRATIDNAGAGHRYVTLFDRNNASINKAFASFVTAQKSAKPV